MLDISNNISITLALFILFITDACPELSFEGGVITYSSDANTGRNFAIGTSASFVCNATGAGLTSADMISCMLPSGADDGTGVWSGATPSCDCEFLSCDSECMHACCLKTNVVCNFSLFFVIRTCMQP